MRYYIIMFCIILFNYSCKKYYTEHKLILTQKKNDIISIEDIKIKKDSNIITELRYKADFKAILSSINDIKYTGNKHSDWLTNNNTYFIANLMEIEQDSLSLKTISYEYKENCVFFIHSLRLNSSKSIKPFLEKIQTKYTKGSLEERVLTFAMKNEKEANFIDIPEKMNPYKLRLELLDTLYKKINSDVVLCHRTKKCVYKNFREKK